MNQQPIGANALWYAPVVGGGNAGAVATYLDHLPAPTPFGDLDSIYNGLDLLNTGDPPPLQDAMNQLSGEAHTALQSVAKYNAEQSVDALLGRLRGFSRHGFGSAGGGGSVGPAPQDESRISLWLDGRGLFGNTPQQGDRSGYDFQIGGFDSGFDVRLRPDLLVGATLGYSRASMSFDRTADSGTIDTVRGGLYGSYTPAPWRITALVVSAFDRYDLTRNIAFLERSASSTYDGYEINSALEAGYVLPLGGLNLEFLTGLDLTSTHASGFTEEGAADVNLIGDSRTATSLRTALGGRVSYDFLLGPFRMTPELTVLWSHDLVGQAHRITARFAGATPGSTFTVYGVQPGRDAVVVGAQVSATTGSHLTWFAAYDGDFRNRLNLQTVTAGVRVQW